MNLKSIPHNIAFLFWKAIHSFSCREELFLLEAEKTVCSVRWALARLKARSESLLRLCHPESSGVAIEIIDYSEEVRGICSEYTDFAELFDNSMKRISTIISARDLYLETAELIFGMEKAMVAYTHRFAAFEEDVFENIYRKTSDSEKNDIRVRYESGFLYALDSFCLIDTNALHNATLDHIHALERIVSVKPFLSLSERDAIIEPVETAWRQYFHMRINRVDAIFKRYEALIYAHDVVNQKIVSLLGYEPLIVERSECDAAVDRILDSWNRAFVPVLG